MLAQRIRAFQVSQGIAGVRFLGVSPDELACRMSWMPWRLLYNLRVKSDAWTETPIVVGGSGE
jgi:hypothetical protein